MTVCDSAQRKSRAPYGRRWLVEALSAFDDRQRRRQAVFEYTSDPACIFRIDVTRASRGVTLRDGTFVRPDDRVVRLHFWNEQIPTLPEDGATIAWARRMQRAIGASLEELARYLAAQPDLADIAVICGHVPSGTKSQSGQIARIMAYYGFETIPETEPLPLAERLHRFGENILISLIVLAHNAGALRSDTLARVRVPIFLSRRALDREFTAGEKVAFGA
jgi:YkoP-like protein